MRERTKRMLTGHLSRIVFGIPFLVFGVNHFMYPSAMTGMVPAFLPFRLFFVYFTGLALIGAGISIITGIQIKLSTLLLSVLLLLFVLLIHVPGLMNRSTLQMSMAALLKDLGLAAAALYMSSTSKK